MLELGQTPERHHFVRTYFSNNNILPISPPNLKYHEIRENILIEECSIEFLLYLFNKVIANLLGVIKMRYLSDRLPVIAGQHAITSCCHYRAWLDFHLLGLSKQ